MDRKRTSTTLLLSEQQRRVTLGERLSQSPHAGTARLRRCGECKLTSPEGDEGCVFCGGSFDTLPPRGLLDGRYALEHELGHGSMGTVLRAEDLTLRRRVAVKLFDLRSHSDTTDLGRFQREAAALAAVRNDHVVQVYSYGLEGGSAFFVMEYVRGRSCESLIREHTRHGDRIPVHRALSILRQIASGLGSVHAAGLLHRDVKPANIVIEERTGRPVLVDFGLVLENKPEVVRFADCAGTPDFIAPEQAGVGEPGDLPGSWSDVYSLGCTAMELLTGRPVFEVDTVEEALRCHKSVKPVLASARHEDLAPLDEVLQQALAKRPASRFESAPAFAAALCHAGARWLESGSDALPVAPAALPSAAVSVFVVDDDPLFARLAVRAVQLAFFKAQVQVHRLEDGRAALAAAQRQLPKLLLLDQNMPGMNGAEMLSRLREMPGGRDVRVVAISASLDDLARWKLELLGAKEFVTKPVDLPSLTRLIGEIGRVEGWIGA